MVKSVHFKVGDRVYVYFGDKLRKHLRKSYREDGYYFIQYEIIKIDDEELILLQDARVCDKRHPYGGHGLALGLEDKHIMLEKKFFSLRDASDKEIKEFSDRCGFKYKEFKEAIKIFRKNDK